MSAEEQIIADNITDSPKEEPKKRPGRPKKARPEIIPADVMGVAPKPVNEENIVEMVYCNPLIFKKILALKKAYNVSEIEIHFGIREVIFSSKDHSKASNIYVIISGELLNYYYCKEPITVHIKCEYLEKILGILDKNQYKVTFFLRENYRSTLYILVQDCEYDKNNNYEVDVGYKPEGIREVRQSDEQYPIKFVLDSKHFKVEINKLKKLAKSMTIQKAGGDHLQISDGNAKKIQYNGVYNNPEKIRLKSTIDDDDIFSVSINIDNIQPFSNSCIGNDVHIAADKQEKMSFTAYLDPHGADKYAVTVKVFSPVIKYNQ
jgi:hypothetical protein